jgi:hypothetical protein
VAVDSNDNVFVSSRVENKVVKIQADGNEVIMTDQLQGGAAGIAVDRWGSVFVSTQFNDIWQFGKGGTFEKYAGANSKLLQGPSGDCTVIYT